MAEGNTFTNFRSDHETQSVVQQLNPGKNNGAGCQETSPTTDTGQIAQSQMFGNPKHGQTAGPNLLGNMDGKDSYSDCDRPQVHTKNVRHDGKPINTSFGTTQENVDSSFSGTQSFRDHGKTNEDKWPLDTEMKEMSLSQRGGEQKADKWTLEMKGTQSRKGSSSQSGDTEVEMMDTQASGHTVGVPESNTDVEMTDEEERNRTKTEENERKRMNATVNSEEEERKRGEAACALQTGNNDQAPWKKFFVTVCFLSEVKKREDATSVLSPMKMQYLLRFKNDLIQEQMLKEFPAISKIVHSCQNLLIEVSQRPPDGLAKQVVTCLQELVEKIRLKSLPLVCCQAATDKLDKEFGDGNLTMFLDKEQIYLVGPSVMIEKLEHILDEIKHKCTLISKEYKLSSFEIYKLHKLGFKEHLFKMYPNVEVDLNEEMGLVILSGKAEVLKLASQEIDNFNKSIDKMEIPMSRYFLQLLQLSEIKSFLQEIMKEQELVVVFEVSDKNDVLTVFASDTNMIHDFQAILDQKLMMITIPRMSKNSGIPTFASSIQFTDIIDAYENKCLIKDSQRRNVCVFTTKKIALMILEMEENYNVQKVGTKTEQNKSESVTNAISSNTEEKGVFHEFKCSEDTCEFLKGLNFTAQLLKQFENCKAEFKGCVLIFNGTKSQILEVKETLDSIGHEKLEEKAERTIPDVCFDFYARDYVKAYIDEKLEKENIPCYWYVCKEDSCLNVSTFKDKITRAKNIILTSVGWKEFVRNSEIESILNDTKMQKFLADQKANLRVDIQVEDLTVFGLEQSVMEFERIYKSLSQAPQPVKQKIEISPNVIKYLKDKKKIPAIISLSIDANGDVFLIGPVENVKETAHLLAKCTFYEEKWECQVDIPRDIKEQICAQKVGELENRFGCSVFVEADTSCVSHQQLAQWVSKEPPHRHVVLVYGPAVDIAADVIVCPANDTVAGKAIFEKGGAVMQNAFQQLQKVDEINLCTDTGNLPCLMVAYLNIPENVEGETMKTNMIRIIKELFSTVEKHQLQSIVIPIQIAHSCPGSTFLHWFCDAFRGFQHKFKYVNQILLCSEDPNTSEQLSVLIDGLQSVLAYFNFTDMFEDKSVHAKARKHPANITVTLVEGKLVDQKVDVIVNSCNTKLELKIGAVSSSILAVAGESILEECRKKYPKGIHYGRVATTKPGKMDCKLICHGALPNWMPTANFSSQILAKLVFDCLLLAENEQGKTIAFPVFGTGKLEYPWHEVAKTMLSTIHRYGRIHPKTLLKEVKIVLFEQDNKSIEAFEDEKTKIEEAVFFQEDHLPPPSRILECRCNSVRVKIEPLSEPEFHQCDAIVKIYNSSEAQQYEKDYPESDLIKNGIIWELYEKRNFYVVSVFSEEIIGALRRALKFSHDNRLASLAIYLMQPKGSISFIEQADLVRDYVYRWEGNRYLQVLKLIISKRAVFEKVVSEIVSKQEENKNYYSTRLKDLLNLGKIPWKCVSYSDVNQSPKLTITLVGQDKESLTDLKEALQKEVASLKAIAGKSLGATIRNSKMDPSLENNSTWVRTSRSDKIALSLDVCKKLDEAVRLKLQSVEIEEGNNVILYDFQTSQYRVQGKDVPLGIFFRPGSTNDQNETVPLETLKRKEYTNKVPDVYDNLHGRINPALRLKAEDVESECKKLKISYDKEVVFGTFEQLTNLNRNLIGKFGVETGVFDFDKKANDLPSNVKKQQTQNDYEHIVRISLSYMEYKMMKFFYPNDPIFKANSQYENGILCTLPDVGENGQTIEDDAKKKLAHLNSYAEFEVVATEGKTIDDIKLGEVYRGIKDISDLIFVFRSNDKKVLKLRGSNYEKLQNAKTKIEFLLGAKQQGKGGRRDRVITTEANYNSKKDEKMDTSTSSYSRSLSTGSSGSSSSKPPPDMSFKTSEGIIIKVYVANILHLNVECIVNAANEHLSHGAGVAEVISRAAGYSFQQECNDYITKYGDLQVTKCCTTSGGNLKYKYVIHVVGPKWYDYPTDKRMCAKDLKKTIENSFYEAENLNVSTIALPAVSSGIFGVPRDVCCSQYCQAVIEYSNTCGRKTCLKEIHFIDKDHEIIKMIQKEFGTGLNMISNPSTGCGPSGHSSQGSGGRISDDKGLFQRSLSSDASTNNEKTSSGQNRDFSYTVQKSSSSKFIKQYKTDKGLKVNILEDDITKMNVDVIVCPQDDDCEGKGGIAKAIAKVSDSVYKKDVFAMKKISKCEVKRYKASPNLPFRYVLHTVPPKWDLQSSKDNQKFMKDLRLTIRNIIRHCSDSGDIKTVAIPILGVGYELTTPYATCAKSLSDVISTEAQTDKFKIDEVNIVTHERGMAIAVADMFDKESIFKTLTSFQRPNKKQQNRQDGKLSDSGTGDEMKGRNNKSDETPFSSKSNNGKLGSTVRGGNLEDCAICLSTPSDPRKLKCGHIFCEGCIGQQFKFKPVCPNCGSIQGVITGDQPPGKMIVYAMPKLKLPGYPDCGRIDISYEIFSGIQGPEHPKPGTRFEGIRRTAYLPDNTRGRKIAKMLEVAFNRKLIFTIGHSRTTGKDGVVTWNDIHHKTSPNIDSQFGYPDPTYFDRVVEELAAKGVTEKDI